MALGREKSPNIWISVLIFTSSLGMTAVAAYLFISQSRLPALSQYEDPGGPKRSGLDVSSILESLKMPIDINLSQARFRRDIIPVLAKDFGLPSPEPTAVLLSRNLIAKERQADEFGPSALLQVPPPPPLFPEDFVALLDFQKETESEDPNGLLPPDPGLLFLGVVKTTNDGPLQALIKDLRSSQMVRLGRNDSYGDLTVENISHHTVEIRLPSGELRLLTTRTGEIRFISRGALPSQAATDTLP